MAKYGEQTPESLEEIWQSRPLAIWPLGALEWHGPHLPLGLDGLVADWFANQVELRTGGVLVPISYSPITTVPHPCSLQVSTQVAAEYWEQMVEGLYKAGARHLLLISGHYAPGHMVELHRMSMRLMHKHSDFKMLAGAPLEMLDDPRVLDHAGESQASQLMAIRPELVKLQNLPREISPSTCAVLGENPLRAKRTRGQQLLMHALEKWTEAADRMRSEGSRDWLYLHAEAGVAAHEEYIQLWHKDSWEQAMVDWWSSKQTS